MRERTDHIDYWNCVKAQGLDNMTERHYQQQRDLAAKAHEELARYTREHENHLKILTDLEEQSRQQEHDLYALKDFIIPASCVTEK